MKNSIYGNVIAKEILMQGLHNHKIAHAYLIYGEKGLGKKTFARYFAMSVMCQEQGEKPCFCCNSCRKISENIHPDFKEYISPEKKLSVGVDFVRELRKDAVVMPNESDTKIYMISDIQNMTLQAANAFLKTLEEPPKNVLFLLTATSLDELPETIVSRVVPVQMFPLTDAQIKTAINDKLKNDENNALSNVSFLEQIVEESGGNLGNALQKMSDTDFLKRVDNLTRFCQMVAQKNEYGFMKELNLYERDKPALLNMLDMFQAEMKKALLFKLNQMENPGEISKQLAKKLAKIQIVDIIDFVSDVKIKLEMNLNYNLMLAYICTGMFSILD